MSKTRKIIKVLHTQATMDGAGVRLQRLFGYHEAPLLDPFLLLDYFGADNPENYRNGFPWHPHRGIETITYMLHGEVEHGDSLGNKGVISAGDVQWMTAGSGIIHQEMPKGDAQGRMYGFQLWANLPRTQKMMTPRYQEFKSSEIPHVVRPNGTTIRIISGSVDGIRGPVQDVVIDPEYLDVTLPARTDFTHEIPADHTVFVCVFDGQARCGELVIDKGTLILLQDGDFIELRSLEKQVRFLLIAGKPLNEPIAWRGPIVMNTQEELHIAFTEYNNGTFIKG